LHCPPTHSFAENIFFKTSALCGKTLCLGVVIEEYPTIWDSLQSSTYFNKFDGPLLSVKAKVSKASHLKYIGKTFNVIFDLTMSYIA
jgi:hypothetical protein